MKSMFESRCPFMVIEQTIFIKKDLTSTYEIYYVLMN